MAELPAFAVRGQKGLGAVLMGDHEFGDHARPTNEKIAAQVAPTPLAHGQGIEEAIADGQPEAVGTFGEEFGDVVGAELDALLKVGPGWIVKLVLDALAVEAWIAQAETDHVQARLLDGFL